MAEFFFILGLPPGGDESDESFDAFVLFGDFLLEGDFAVGNCAEDFEG